MDVYEQLIFVLDDFFSLQRSKNRLGLDIDRSTMEFATELYRIAKEDEGVSVVILFKNEKVHFLRVCLNRGEVTNTINSFHKHALEMLGIAWEYEGQMADLFYQNTVYHITVYGSTPMAMKVKGE